MRKFKEQKAITLIALIITIIVLLILAVVAIGAIKNDGIIQYAQNAKTDYTQKDEEEQEQLAGYEQKLMEQEYLLENAKNPDGKTYEEYVLDKVYGLKIGDYVSYTYDAVNDGYTLEKKYTGHTSDDRTIKQVTGLKWRVLGVDKNGNVELISEVAPVVGNADTYKVPLNTAIGYNNGVYLLNDICEKLYSNATLGIKARNITLEDIEANYSDAGLEIRKKFNSGYSNYGETKTISSTNVPLIFEEERAGKIGISESFYTKKDELITESATKYASGLNIKQAYYNILSPKKDDFKNENMYNMIFNDYYWVASRYVNCVSSSNMKFGIFQVTPSNLSGAGLYSSNGAAESGANRPVRPVVTISSGCKVNTSSGNGSSTSPYTIEAK